MSCGRRAGPGGPWMVTEEAAQPVRGHCEGLGEARSSGQQPAHGVVTRTAGKAAEPGPARVAAPGSSLPMSGLDPRPGLRGKEAGPGLVSAPRAQAPPPHPVPSPAPPSTPSKRSREAGATPRAQPRTVRVQRPGPGDTRHIHREDPVTTSRRKTKGVMNLTVFSLTRQSFDRRVPGVQT